MFLLLKDSEAAAKTATSSTRASIARSRPARLGTSAAYVVPFRRVIPAKTSAASAICGTHVGLTNADTSMVLCPASLSRLTNAILSAVEIEAASFCSPSRGPTSTRLTLATISIQIDEARARLNEFACAAMNCANGAVTRCADRKFHLHRFEHDERVTALHPVARPHLHGHDGGRHGRGQRSVMMRCAARCARALGQNLVYRTIAKHPRGRSRDHGVDTLDALAAHRQILTGRRAAHDLDGGIVAHRPHRTIVDHGSCRCSGAPVFKGAGALFANAATAPTTSSASGASSRSFMFSSTKPVCTSPAANTRWSSSLTRNGRFVRTPRTANDRSAALARFRAASRDSPLATSFASSGSY